MERIARLIPILVLGCGGRIDPGLPDDDDLRGDGGSFGDAGAGFVDAARDARPVPECLRGIATTCKSQYGTSYYAAIPPECASTDCYALCVAICGGAKYPDNPSPQWDSCSKTDAGTLSCHSYQGAGGRRPEGFETSAASFFAISVELEAASITAFEILEAELIALGAPEALAHAANRAAKDERRHARAMAALAARFGVECSTHRPKAAVRERSLFAIALENAIEGCVRETFAAAVAAWQAKHATDEIVKRTMRPIAADEARHADLAWDLHDWILPRLSTDERARIRTAMREEMETLHAAVGFAEDPRIGLPNRAEASALASAMQIQLWDIAA